MKKDIDHSQRSHAILSASGAVRWLNCPPSALMEAELPDTSTEYSRAGTLAHEFCDINLKEYFQYMSKSVCTRNRNKFRKEESYSQEMEEHAKGYLDYVIEKIKDEDAYVLAETKVDFSGYVPDGFGTCDCIIIQNDTLTIIDFKYGVGVKVSAENNPQMKLYALGAIDMFSEVYDFDKVEMCIYQPRLNNIDECISSVEEIVVWGEKVVRPTAELAINGKGEFKGGDYCHFCKLSAKCKHLCQHNMEVIKDEFKDESGTLSTACLTPNDYAMILERMKLVKNWLTKVEDHVIHGILNNELEIPGYKVVEGRSIRKYRNADEVANRLINNGYEESVIYEKNLLSLSKLEKVLGKKTFTELLSDMVDKPKGKPTIALATDKRPSYTLDVDFEDVS